MSDAHAARCLISACLQRGIREFVLCGGARNAALIALLAELEGELDIRLWRHFEERSAGFFALGRCMATAEACAVITTSGTAAAELLPAVIEAHYQHRPLLLITADRPATFRDSGAPQCIDQNQLFGRYAPMGELAAWTGVQPWHVNIELEETLPAASAWTEPPVLGEWRVPVPRLNVAALSRWLHTGQMQGLVVILGGLEPEEREEVWHFLRELRVPVVAEACSGMREAMSDLHLIDADRLLRDEPPGKILRLGDVPSGRFWRDLENLPQTEVWSICRNGLPGLARESGVVQGEVHRVLQALGQPPRWDDRHEYRRKSLSRAARLDDLLEAFPESEPALVRTISLYASLGQCLFLGNSLPIREWDAFAQWQRAITEVRANRGANGIDGQISTWLGWSAATTQAWCLVGDLTALYDLAAPFMLEQIDSEGRVLVVINNGGGRIFEHLPRMQALSPRAQELMLNPHQTSLAPWAEMWKMRHLLIRRLEDFDQLEPGPTPLLVEVCPDADQTAEFWKRWHPAP